MHIAIIGAGNVGRALGHGWSMVGHTVTFGVRQPQAQKHDELRQTPGVGVEAVGTAAQGAEVVVLATPWEATEQAIKAAGSMAGKIVVDCTNPLKPGLAGLTHGHEDSGGEQVARWAPGARVVKAFNTVGSNIMQAPELEGRKAVMFICGDDDEARTRVVELSDALGFDTVDAGSLASARMLEPLALLWISAAYKFGFGRDFAFSIVRR